MRRKPLDEYLTEQLKVDSELRRILELAARQSSARVRNLELKAGSSIGARMRIAQLEQVLLQIVGIQTRTWVQGVGPLILRSYPKVQAAAARSFTVIENLLTDVVGNRQGEALIKSFRQTTRVGFNLDRVRRARALSPRVYRNAALSSGAVERQIRAGIIQGLSARELAGEVKRYISPTTPGGVSYAAMRLARTELNNAFHEAQKIQADAPWVNTVQWNRSATHASRVPKPDACDRLATQDIYEYGPGKYPADRVPDKPHPQCLCYTTYDLVSPDEMLRLLPSFLESGGARIA